MELTALVTFAAVASPEVSASVCASIVVMPADRAAAVALVAMSPARVVEGVPAIVSKWLVVTRLLAVACKVLRADAVASVLYRSAIVWPPAPSMELTALVTFAAVASPEVSASTSAFAAIVLDGSLPVMEVSDVCAVDRAELVAMPP
jgi:hypothetical protein